MTYLLDTDTLTLAQHDRRPVADRIEAVRLPDLVGIPEAVRAEALSGRMAALLKAGDGPTALRASELLLATERFIARFQVVRFDPVAAGHLDRLRKGKKAWKGGHKDLLVACLTLAHHATLVTRNTKDFAGIPGLKVENWAD